MTRERSNPAEVHTKELHEIAWLLEDELQGVSLSKPTTYGDITELNTERTILDSVGRETLKMLAEDIMALLDTSVAVYEKNGDYAFGCFVSEWCSLMDNASRKLCDTADNRKALDCGRWLCHENCWNDSARAAMESGMPNDIACVGGIRLYAVPIRANDAIIGAINMGYGNPPTDEQTLKTLSRTFDCDSDSLRKAAEAFNPRPQVLIEMAKKRLRSIAVQIGKTVELARNEEKLKDLALFLEENRNPTLRIDRGMHLLYANPSAMELVVESGRGVGEKIPAQWHTIVQRVWTDGIPQTLDVPLGDRVYSFTATPIRERGYINVYGTDVTERKQAEDDFHDAQRMLQTVLDTIPTAVFWKDHTLRYLGANRSWLDGIGAGSLKDIVGKTDYELHWEKKQADAFRADDIDIMESGIPRFNIVEPYRGADGGQSWARTNKAPLRDNQGRIIGILGTFEDITESKKQQEALERSEERFKILFEMAPDAYYLNDMTGTFIDGNRRAEELTGYSRDELIGRNFKNLKLLSPTQLPNAIQALALNALGKPFGPKEFRINRKDGERIGAEISTYPVTIDDKRVVLGIARDITERVKMAKRQRFLAGILDSSPVAVIATDEQATITYVNRATQELFGYHEAELLGKNARILNASEDSGSIQGELLTTIDSGRIWRGELLNRKKSGEQFPLNATVFRMLDSDGDFLANVGFQEDISQRKRQEEVNRNAQRLESLGVLAGGIAHDFNNLLGGIFGNIDLALDALGDERKIQRYLERGIGALDRARDLTRQLLTFSKGGAPHKRLVDISRILEQSQHLSLSGSTIDCSITVAPQVSAIEADENQLCQVFNNLMINARQAMPSGGKLLITLDKRTVKAGAIHDLATGEYVEITFKDEGVGIPDTLINKVFDPFFTTKDTGSGLGMSTSYSIIRKHDGTILIDSQVGKGTTVTVYLPVGSAALPMAHEESTPVIKAGGRVLVMDDEEVMRDVAQGMLELLGCEVVCTREGGEAVDVFREHMNSATAFDMVLLDLTVPGGMGGEEAMREIRKLDKDVPGIVASGYADSPVLSRPESYGFSGKIEKPYRRPALSKAIEEALKGKSD